MSEPTPFEIRLTPDFQRQVKILSKRYRSLKTDLSPVIEQLRTREPLGDQISGIGFRVMKVRVKNSDISKGKSSGYRLIYWISSDELIVLLDIYSKSDRSNVDAIEIRQIINRFSTSLEDIE